jgi:uncharacterized damage-inducible protein DinB
MIAEYIKASLSSTRNELAEVFPHITNEILDWAPVPGMRTIKGQFVEIIGTEISMIELMREDQRTPFAEIDADLNRLTEITLLVAKLTSVRNSTLDFLDSLDEDGLSKQVLVSPGFGKYLELDSVPVSELLRFLVRHEAYHTGQLMSYLWAKGNNPYQW